MNDMNMNMNMNKNMNIPSSLVEALNGLVDRLNESSVCVRVLLIGTNEGLSLSRCYGSSAKAVMREDILASVETAWATLPSGCPPQVLASAWAATPDTFQQPAHPMLKPLGLGDTIKTVLAFYDRLTLIHFHLPPVVATIIAVPQVNVNMIQSVALPILKILLEPVAQAMIAVRKGTTTTSHDRR